MGPVLLANKYLLLKRIAAGGMAEIFLAKQVGLDGFEKLVVVKRILPEFVNQPGYVRMFLDEARAGADLRHPNIVSTIEIGEDHGSYFIVMEYLHGLDLRFIFRRLAAQKEKIPLSIAVGIVMEVCAGLQYAHKKTDLKGRSLGIVHRDVSPQNLVVTFDGETKIVDFGIAQGAHLKEQDPKGILKGKFGYMSPEQAEGDELDQRTDQFSLGIILYELTTMQRVFKRSDAHDQEEALALTADCQIQAPHTHDPNYPRALEAIVLRAVAKEREKRFADCEALRKALAQFLEAEKISYSRDQLAAYMRERFGGEQSVPVESTLSYERYPAQASRKRLVLAAFAVATVLISSAAWWFLCAADEPVVIKAPLVALAPPSEQPVQTLGEPQKFVETSPPAKPERKQIEVRKFGRLKIVVEPWGEIEIDGKLIGLTPLAPQKISEGTHTVRIKNPRLGPDKTLKVVIRANQDTLVRHLFESKS